MTDSAQTMIALNAVPVDRSDEFENWLRTVVVPAMRDQRPDLAGRWRLLRATESDDGTVTYAFVCEGGVPDDWDLQPLLENALGAEGADRALEDFAGMLRGEQQAWFFTRMPLDGA